MTDDSMIILNYNNLNNRNKSNERKFINPSGCRRGFIKSLGFNFPL